MLGGIGMPELLIILVIIMIVFGAGKLPDIGAGMGKAIKNFKKATQDQEEPTTAKQNPDRLDDKTQGAKS
ncbi:MAG TPA: twin-arginine translocase TatA/TatE family subunit [Syntrophobacteraceae bacterium]|nr:twin-arginine translocase TatA/TatE family subunit [Syntrophobacteraceae bacterium]HBZ54741.1 twin-arginine translocase TatA/TatE family subunit [Syntrophobacteraceae bacterium]